MADLEFIALSKLPPSTDFSSLEYDQMKILNHLDLCKII